MPRTAVESDPGGGAGSSVSCRILVAGIGNIFFGDDGFGVEVARRLAAGALPDSVRVADYGISGLHLAYDLLEGAYETVILVDATPRGEVPGTVSLIEPDLDRPAGPPSTDAHSMTPQVVFEWLASLGGQPSRVLIVGCEPARVEEEMGLSAEVARGVEEAVRLIAGLVRSRAAASGAERAAAS